MIQISVNRDFAEMLLSLSAAGAEFMLVGAHARAAYGIPRATADIDIWVRATPENAPRVWKALADYGAPLHDLTLDDLSRPGVVFQIGLPPYRIDILTEISGVTFDEAWPNRLYGDFGGATYPVIGRDEFLRNKRAAGRPKDLSDIDDVERHGRGPR
jgi:hypothetical protein